MKKKLLASIPILTASLFAVDYLGSSAIVDVHEGVYHFLRPKSPNIPLLLTDDKNIKPFTFKTFDSLKLNGLFIAAPNKDAPVIIMLHGIRGRKEGFLPFADTINHWGFHLILLDQRAHGESEGKYCSFGYHEKKDIAALLDYLPALGITHNNVGVWGQSLGGAVALQALELESRLKFGIIESTFATFDNIVYDYAKFHLGFNFPWLSDYLIKRASKKAGFPPKAVQPYLSAKGIHQPVLLAHGNKDQRINIAYGKRIYKNLASTNKQFINVPNANHFNVWEKGGENYFNQVRSFLERVSSQ